MHIFNPHRELITSGLVSWWPADTGSGTTLYDVIGPGTSSSWINMYASNWDAGLGGRPYSLRFNGTDEYIGGIGTTSTYSFVQNTGVFTIFFRAQFDEVTDTSSTGADIIMGTSIASTGKGFAVIRENRATVGPTQALRVFIVRGVLDQPLWDASVNDVITDTDEHSYAITGDISNVRFYVDGSSVGSPVGRGYPFPTGNSTYNLNIGRGNYVSTVLPMDGRLGGIRIYNTTKTAAEIAAMHAGSG